MNEFDWTQDEETEADRREREIAEKKRKIGLAINALLAILVLITFGSCASRLAYRASAPLMTLSGEQWDESWETIGKKMGVDPALVPENWTLDYNEEISSSDKVYMTLYGYGTPDTVTYTDNNNQEAERSRYKAGWYIMTRGSGSADAAQSDLEEWKSVQSQACIQWEELDSITLGSGDSAVTYECFSYTYEEGQSEDYNQGVIAYTKNSGWAICYQLDWNDDLGWGAGEGVEQLTALLGAMQYAK